MELQLNKEPVFLNEVIYDGQTEQGVEFDYVLPDYYPDIFKILRCSLTPGISSYSVSGTQLFIDGAVLIKILCGTQIHLLQNLGADKSRRQGKRVSSDKNRLC